MAGDSIRTHKLPWVASDSDPPEGVAICLSGGGLRSAAFSLGALQALQGVQGLLFGESPARLLVAVSGGSYVAASHALTAESLPVAEQPPLAKGTPEAAWIGSRSRYLFGGGLAATSWRLLAKFVLPGAINIAALFSLFTWTGFLLADFAWLIGMVPDSEWMLPVIHSSETGRLLDTGIFVALAFVGVRLWFQEGLYHWLGVIQIFLAMPFIPSALASMEMSPITSDPTIWLSGPGPVTGVLAASIVIIAASYIGPMLKQRLLRVPMTLLGAASSWVPRLIGLVLLSLAATTWRRALLVFDTAEASLPMPFGAWFIATLLGPLVLGYFSARFSLHRSYRALLSGCFSVLRSEGVARPVSPLAPMSDKATAVSPRLVVAATANVRARRNGRIARHHPYAFSHDFSGIPGIESAILPTAKLEQLWAPGKEPQVSLMTAVAATGAALSPSMGRFTNGGLRAFLAAFNVRLGRWVGNPLSEETRLRVSALVGPGWPSPRKRLGASLDELVQEAFGLHARRQATVYVSDGGHYDNLGLLTTLHGRPKEIWCIDASADRKGLASELRRCMQIVSQELPRSAIHLPDVDSFRVVDGYHSAIAAHGSITYSDGSTAKLHVAKLGLTSGSDPWFTRYRDGDRRFPYQSTPNQDFPRSRFEAYRRLGFDNTMVALAPLEAGASDDTN